MPIDPFIGIINESWNVVYNNETIKLEVKRPQSPHGLFITNKNGFRARHPWEIFFCFFNELVMKSAREDGRRHARQLL
jgi:hypothetical protein